MARMAIQSRLFTRLAMRHILAWAPRYGDVKIDEELDRDWKGTMSYPNLHLCLDLKTQGIGA